MNGISQNNSALTQFINMDDKTLRQHAKMRANEEYQNRPNKFIEKATLPVLIGTAALSAALTPEATKISSKLSLGGKALAGWGLFLGTFGVYKAITDKINNKNPEIKEARRKNAFLTMLIDGTLIYGAYCAISKAGSMALDKIKDSVSFKNKKGEKINYTSICEKVSKTIDKSKAGQWLVEKFTKHPNATKGLNSIASLAFLATLVVSVFKGIRDNTRHKETTERIFHQLKNRQNALAKEIAQENEQLIKEREELKTEGKTGETKQPNKSFED